MLSNDGNASLGARVTRLKGDVDALLTAGAIDPVEDATVQQLLVMALKLYVGKLDAGASFAPFEHGDVTATEVAVATTRMLKVVNLEVFELGLWTSWGSL